jgi:hypothetical protein
MNRGVPKKSELRAELDICGRAIDSIEESVKKAGLAPPAH